jgi:hypothetical protein
MRTRLAPLLLAFLAGATLAGAVLAPTFAQGTRPSASTGVDENRREVRQLAEMLDIPAQAEALLVRMRTEMIRATIAASTLAEDEAARIVDDILMPNFTARSAELTAEMMEPYAVNLTISDLKALRAFFVSSLGQRWLRVQKLARAQGEEAGLAWGQRVFQDSVDRHVDELRARGLKF